jgi:hypothetical protein
LDNAEVKHAATLDPHGTAADPCTQQELIAKFKQLAALSAARVPASAVIEAVSRLDEAPSVRELTALLRV